MNKEITKIAVKAVTQEPEGSDEYLLGCYVLLNELSNKHFDLLADLVVSGFTLINDANSKVITDLFDIGLTVGICYNGSPDYIAASCTSYEVAKLRRTKKTQPSTY